MANEPHRKDYKVPVVPKTGDKVIDLPIKAPSGDAAKQLAERIAKRRGWKSAKIGKPEES